MRFFGNGLGLGAAGLGVSSNENSSYSPIETVIFFVEEDVVVLDDAWSPCVVFVLGVGVDVVPVGETPAVVPTFDKYLDASFEVSVLPKDEYAVEALPEPSPRRDKYADDVAVPLGIPLVVFLIVLPRAVAVTLLCPVLVGEYALELGIVPPVPPNRVVPFGVP